MKKKIIKSLITVGSYSQQLSNILKISKEKKSSYVCIANVHMTIEVYNDKAFEKIVNNADIITPDGMPIAKALDYLYDINQDRISGMDLMPSLMKSCEEGNKSIFLYGSTNEVLDKIVTKAKIEYPTLKIDYYSPPFRVLSEDEKNKIIININKFNYDFVFVSLGCPKQEKWMAEHKGKINSCMIGLGGALEVYAGVKNRAPKWMQNYSLEWLYRLIQDPKRLWKRYFYTNNLFIILFLKQLIQHKLEFKERNV